MSNQQPIVLFDAIGLLVDGRRIRQCYQANMIQVMTARYGKSPDFWRLIDQQIVEDWASYHADLNYSGEDGIADMYEGIFRLTRALFTIANIVEPPKPDITALAHHLMTLPCDRKVLLADVYETLIAYQQKGYQLATFGYLLHLQLVSMMAALPMITHHIGADTLQQYEHDRQYFMKITTHFKTSADQITVLTPHPQTFYAASQAGLRSQLVRQLSTFVFKI
ncbi:MAG: hypothetical protein WBC91_24205 [Phototrophicaceae bacterium]